MNLYERFDKKRLAGKRPEQPSHPDGRLRTEEKFDKRRGKIPRNLQERFGRMGRIPFDEESQRRGFESP